MSQIVLTFDLACGMDERKAAFWADALDKQAQEFCEKWGCEYSPVTYYSTDVLQKLDGDELAAFVADSYLCTVQTSLEVQGALGFHDDVNGVIFARELWQGDDTSVTLSHEILELLGDKTCDEYTGLGDGRKQAVEACDRVESDTYMETGTVGTDSMPVLVSNYLLPPAFVPDSAGPWDRMTRLTSWNGMTPGGYMIVQAADGSETQVFAETPEGYANAFKKRGKPVGRLSRRLAK